MLSSTQALNGNDASSRVHIKSRSLSMSTWLLLRYLFNRITSINWHELMQPRVMFSWEESTSLRTTGTSWLDGLRGIAALQVVFFHFFGAYTPWGRTYGSSEEDRYIHQLPIFRSIYAAGSSAVSVFFVISGYAITVKCLILLRRKNFEELYKSLASSVIRRGFRLFLPLFLLAFPMLVLIRCVDMSRDGYIYPYEHRDSFAQQVVHLFNATDNHINPFMYPLTNPTNNRYAYIPVAWTIPYEYHGSITCYLMMLIVSRVPVFKVRAIIIGGMAIYSLHRGCWWASNFLVGMLTADYVLQQQSQKGSVTLESSTFKRKCRTAFYYFMFFCGYYLGGMCPKDIPFDFDPKPKPGYEFLYKLYPSQVAFGNNDFARWWWYWSGNFTFFAISQLPRLRAICESHFCQWLGKLSYALYLVHAAVIGALSTPIRSMVKDFTESKLILCLVEFSLILPISFVLAGIVERYIDRPSVQFARYFERLISQDRPTEQEERLLDTSAMEMEQRLDRNLPADYPA